MRFSLVFIFLQVLVFANSTVGLQDKLGKNVDLSLEFIDHKGKVRTLKELVNKPTIISLNYYECNSICDIQIDALANILDKVKLKEGEDFNILTISFNHEEKLINAIKKRKEVLSVLSEDFKADAWSFLYTNNENDILTFTKSIGFDFKKITFKDKDGKEQFTYQHPAIIVFVDKSGKIIRYLAGANGYLPLDIELAVSDSKQGNIGSVVNRAKLFCFAYDANSGEYVLAWKKIFGIIISVFLMALFIYAIKSRKKEKNE